MGDDTISPVTDQNKAEFLHHLICDIRALEQMIDDGQIESGVTRIGAEQEVCLVNRALRPAMVGGEILQANDETHFTSELALWNLEINLDPLEAGPGCLTSMNSQLTSLLQLASEKAEAKDCSVVLTGILPTIRKSELDVKYMTPSPRFKAFDRTLREMRGEDFWLFIEGVDEVNLKHSSILFEACNTSFQIHLQVEPDDFVDKYNWAQVVTGPVLAACTNSPMLLGRELWAETRIALFRHSIETRRSSNYVVDRQPRVAFGRDWLKKSAAEVFKSDMAIYDLIISADVGDQDSLQRLAAGEIPRLQAMNLHNGTLYKWNRACYGIMNGKPHLRIENRYIPSGPTPIDEMANVALWIGLMQAMPEKCRGKWEKHFRFQDVRCNFLKAARNGLSNEMRWFGQSLDAAHLILDHLLPMAAGGLKALGIPAEEYQVYLDIIHKRVVAKQTGSSWIIDSLRQLREKNSLDESLLMITQYMKENCLSGSPVHEWTIPGNASLHLVPDRYARVDSIMITTVVTVREDDGLELAATLMDWNDFGDLPVENSKGEIVGMISNQEIKNLDFDSALDSAQRRRTLISACMTSDIIVVAPETALDKAEKLMRVNELESLPVVRDNYVIGIITANDIRDVAAKVV